ncbi:hypothetical protein BTVI_113135 [Pitangus sulphuratus]|nr:hypothetical protein BTVI_113135 [Pitangus sulphuratus]
MDKFNFTPIKAKYLVEWLRFSIMLIRITADPDPVDPVSTLFCKLCTAEEEEEDRYCEWLRGLDAVGSEYQHQLKGSKEVCDSLTMLINGRSGIWSSLWTLSYVLLYKSDYYSPHTTAIDVKLLPGKRISIISRCGHMIQEAIERIWESYGLAYGFGLVKRDLPETLERAWHLTDSGGILK